MSLADAITKDVGKSDAPEDDEDRADGEEDAEARSYAADLRRAITAKNDKAIVAAMRGLNGSLK